MFISVGFNHAINSDQVLMILDYNSQPTRDYVARAREQDKVLKMTKGRRTRSVLILTDGFIAQSSWTVKRLMKGLWASSPSA